MLLTVAVHRKSTKHQSVDDVIGDNVVDQTDALLFNRKHSMASLVVVDELSACNLHWMLENTWRAIVLEQSNASHGKCLVVVVEK